MGLMDTVKAKIAKYREHSANKNEFREKLMAAVADGSLNDEEVRALQKDFGSLDLTLDDLSRMRVQAYAKAMEVASADGLVTYEEQLELDKLQAFLKIPDNEISGAKATLRRLRLVTEIQQGNPPIANVSHVVLQKTEVAHWVERAELLEDRVVGRRYVGSSSGLSIRIAKGVSYRVGQSRGALLTDREVQAVSQGEFIVTSRRVLFRGDKKSFSFRLDQLLDINMFRDGLRVTGPNGSPRILKFSRSENVDIIGSVISLAVNRLSQ